MSEYQNIQIFLQTFTLQIGLGKVLRLKMLKYCSADVHTRRTK